MKQMVGTAPVHRRVEQQFHAAGQETSMTSTLPCREFRLPGDSPPDTDESFCLSPGAEAPGQYRADVAEPRISTALGSFGTATLLRTLPSEVDSGGELRISSRLRDLRATWSDRLGLAAVTAAAGCRPKAADTVITDELSSTMTDENAMLLGRTSGRFTLDRRVTGVDKPRSKSTAELSSSRSRFVRTPCRCIDDEESTHA